MWRMPPSSMITIPSWQQIKNVTQAATTFAADAFKIASEEEQRRRLDICYSCSHYRDSKCDRCQCYLTWKAWIQSSHCPESHW